MTFVHTRMSPWAETNNEWIKTTKNLTLCCTWHSVFLPPPWGSSVCEVLVSRPLCSAPDFRCFASLTPCALVLLLLHRTCCFLETVLSMNRQHYVNQNNSYFSTNCILTHFPLPEDGNDRKGRSVNKTDAQEKGVHQPNMFSCLLVFVYTFFIFYIVKPSERRTDTSHVFTPRLQILQLFVWLIGSFFEDEFNHLWGEKVTISTTLTDRSDM